MDNSRGAMHLVIDDDRDTIGCRDAEADARTAGNQGIYPLQQSLFLFGRSCQIGVVHRKAGGAVCLVGNDQLDGLLWQDGA